MLELNAEVLMQEKVKVKDIMQTSLKRIDQALLPTVKNIKNQMEIILQTENQFHRLQ